MNPGSILLGEPSTRSPGSLAISACLDCGWLTVADQVPASCGFDWRHRAPAQVAAWLFCGQGCWEGEFFNYQTCDRGHETWIDPQRSRFL